MVTLPETTLDSLARIPEGAGAAMLVRHSARPPIPPGSLGDDVLLTEEGVTMARALGERLTGRLRRLYASPVPRCVQTARAVGEGAGVTIDPEPRAVLGAPGAFIVDRRAAWEVLMTHGTVGAAWLQVSQADPLPGLRRTCDGVRLVVSSMLEGGLPAGRLDVHVTHDGVLAVVAGTLAGFAPGPTAWPEFLEGLVLWQDGASVHAAWQGEVHPVSDTFL